MTHPPLPNYNVIVLPEDAHEKLNLMAAGARNHYEKREQRLCRICYSIKVEWGSVCGPCISACSHKKVIPGYIVASNGIASGWFYCLICEHVKALPRGSTIFNICLRSHVGTVPPCERCGSTDGSELQHWGPQAIFDDADKWPTSWLCRSCHQLWHRAMRAAKGVSVPEGQRFGEKQSREERILQNELREEIRTAAWWTG